MDINELIFSLSLSEAFKHLKKIAEWEQNAQKIEKRTPLILLISIIPTLLIFAGIVFLSLNAEQQPLIAEKKAFSPIIELGFGVMLIVSLLSLLIGEYYTTISPALQMNKHFANNKFIKKERMLFRFFKKIQGVSWGLLMSILLYLPLFLIFMLFWYYYLPILNTLGLVVFSFFSTLFSIGTIVFTYMFFNLILPDIKTNKKDKSIYLSIEKNQINQRGYITKVFLSFSSDKYLNKFITDLENNVKVVYGKFPNSFLKLGESREMTRLIQLEEKWREAERKKN